MSRPSTPRTGRKRDGCPLCGAPTAPAHAPFCGQGCRDRDLLNWLGDAYRTPGPPADAEGREITPDDGLDSGPDRPL